MKIFNILFAYLLFLMISYCSVFAQSTYFTKSGHIDFFSHTPIEDIIAVNNQVTSFLDISTGEIVFSVLMRSFEFEKAMMQEHFNENYIESEKFPKASFKGEIVNSDKIDWKSSGEINVQVQGILTIHGVKNKITSNGTIEVHDDLITARSKFEIKPEDYEIKIPKIVREKIARVFILSVTMNYELYK